jgi:hypothetical protein
LEFSGGGRFHSNPDITDVVYISLYRSNLSPHSPLLEWMTNSDFNLKLHFSQQTRHLVREEFIIGKKYPSAYKDYIPTLDLGLVWASPEEFSGILHNRISDTITFLLRPSIEF